MIEYSYVLNNDIDYCAKQPYMRNFSGKRILVIGATGMIGSYLMRVLLRYFREYDGDKGKVYGLCRNREKLRVMLGDDYDESALIVENILDCSGAIVNSDIDIAIFAAGYTDRQICINAPDDIYRVNTEGLYNMLKVCHDLNAKRFVFLSSALVYGQMKKKTLLNEKENGILDFTDSGNVYAQSKRMGETICKCFSKQYGIDIKIVRPFHMYGPGTDIDNSNLVSSSIKNALECGKIVLYSHGMMKRNMTYLRDMICKILMVSLSKVEHTIINLGSSGNDITVDEWVNLVCEKAGAKKEYAASIDACNKSGDADLCPDLFRQSLVEKEFNYTLRNFTVAEGIEFTLEHFMCAMKNDRMGSKT